MSVHREDDVSCGLRSSDFTQSEIVMLDLYIHASGFIATLLMLLSVVIVHTYIHDKPIGIYVFVSFICVLIEMIIVKTFKARIRLYAKHLHSLGGRKKQAFIAQIYKARDSLGTTKPTVLDGYYSRMSLLEKGLVLAFILSFFAGVGAMLVLICGALIWDQGLIEQSKVAVIVLVDVFKMGALGTMSASLMRFRGMLQTAGKRVCRLDR